MKQSKKYLKYLLPITLGTTIVMGAVTPFLNGETNHIVKLNGASTSSTATEKTGIVSIDTNASPDLLNQVNGNVDNPMLIDFIKNQFCTKENLSRVYNNLQFDMDPEGKALTHFNFVNIRVTKVPSASNWCVMFNVVVLPDNPLFNIPEGKTLDDFNINDFYIEGFDDPRESSFVTNPKLTPAGDIIISEWAPHEIKDSNLKKFFDVKDYIDRGFPVDTRFDVVIDNSGANNLNGVLKISQINTTRHYGDGSYSIIILMVGR